VLSPSILKRVFPLIALSFTSLAAPKAARADELELGWGGRLQHDLHFRVEPVGVGGFYRRLELPAGIERSQSAAGLKLDATYGSIKGVAAVDFVLSGVQPEVTELGDLSRVEAVDPYRIEVPALYVDIKNFLVSGLDLRVGQQTVLWGEADQFNPTNNLNPDDLRDPLLFGRQQANFMVKLDYWVSETFSISGVVVPIFRPALLPQSAALGLAAVDRIPVADSFIRHRLEADMAASGGKSLGHPTVVANATTELPEASFENMQMAYRLAGTIAEQDVALSYYYGRTDFPQPLHNHTRHSPGERCNPNDPSDCVKGILETDVTLHYPRMHVYGLNAAGEIPLDWIAETLAGLGYRFEGALVVPSRSTLKITNDALALEIPQPAGEYDYDADGTPGGPEPAVVKPTPFLKWTVGLDYTLGENIYVNAQWVHGLMDEYGAGDFISEGYAVRSSSVTSSDIDTITKCALLKDGTTCAQEVLRNRLGDYIVIGVDYKFLNDNALLRLFTIWDVTGVKEEHWDKERKERVSTSHSIFSAEGFSAVLYPEFNYNFGNGLELGAGALFQLGKEHTKFGDPATGGDLVWTRGRFSF
jgi:hypothetical protein